LLLLAALLAAGIVYFTLPGIGTLIFGDYANSVFCFAGAVTCAAGVMVLMRRVGWGRVTG